MSTLVGRTRWRAALTSAEARDTLQEERGRFIATIRHSMPLGASSQQLVVATLDCVEEGVAGVLSAHALLSENTVVHLVDLTAKESLASAAARLQPQPPVWRPIGPASLVSGREDLFLGDLFKGETLLSRPGDVTLILSDVDPGSNVRSLRALAERAIVLVKAGRSSAQRAQGAGDVLRAADLDVRGLVVIGPDEDDATTGLLPQMPWPTTSVKSEWVLPEERTAAAASGGSPTKPSVGGAPVAAARGGNGAGSVTGAKSADSADNGAILKGAASTAGPNAVGNGASGAGAKAAAQDPGRPGASASTSAGVNLSDSANVDETVSSVPATRAVVLPPRPSAIKQPKTDRGGS